MKRRDSRAGAVHRSASALGFVRLANQEPVMDGLKVPWDDVAAQGLIDCVSRDKKAGGIL